MTRPLVLAVLTALFVVSVLSVQCYAAITIDTVFVGDPGNSPDTRYHPFGIAQSGSVAYAYRIGKYETTAGQYTAFLNAVARTDTYGLYSQSMWSSSFGCKIQQTGSPGSYQYSVAVDWADRPVNYVSYWDACRFVNWLNNGQPVGLQNAYTTEDGAYTLSGYNGNDGHDIERNSAAKWFIPSDDEWYKAAYYKGEGTNAGYWNYPTMSNATPANQVLQVDTGNSANYWIDGYVVGSPYYRTNVGEYENSASAYGTYDQGGNVWEIDEAIPYAYGTWHARAVRGGYFHSSSGELSANEMSYNFPLSEGLGSGFRVAGISTVPEPSSLMILAGGILGLAGVIRRRNG